MHRGRNGPNSSFQKCCFKNVKLYFFFIDYVPPEKYHILCGGIIFALERECDRGVKKHKAVKENE